jgi:hypothetical protein
MRKFSFQFSTDYSSALSRQSIQRQANLDRTTFDRVRSEFKEMMLPPFGRKLRLLDPFS